MDSNLIELQYIFIFILLWLISLLIFFYFYNKSNKSIQNVHLPPSPPSLPFIGHLHLIRSLPSHKPLQRLSSKYGPLLYIRIFNTPIVLVSSALVAYDIYKTQDVNFSSRFPYVMDNSIVFGPYGFITAPYGDYWKFMKKITMKDLLGPQHLERSRKVRAEELERFFLHLLEKSKRNEAINVRKEMMKLTNNSICRMTMGKRCSEETGEAQQVRGLVSKSLDMAKKLLVENALGPLKRFGISLVQSEVQDISRRFDDILEKYLREHEENPNTDNRDMMDILLEAYHDKNAEYKISRSQIKAFFVELFIGGTDTSSQATQWTMAELFNHPHIFKKLRAEIDSVVGKTKLIQEADLPNLPYLQAVVKEGLRLHPPGTLSPRRCGKWCKVSGYDIPENTTVIINAYAIMRDENSWGENPDEFRPERFMEMSKGLEGNQEEGVKYLPFGNGRRACPGASLAYVFMGMAIGAMVQCFDWNFKGDKINMEEAGGITLTMAHPFNTTPILRFNPLTTANYEE